MSARIQRKSPQVQSLKEPNANLSFFRNRTSWREFDAPPGAEAFTNLVDSLFKPVSHPIDRTNFTNIDGKVFTLSQPPLFTKPLGKKLVILDVDSRPLDKEGELLHPGGLKWKGISRLTAGMLSHYLYGMRGPS